MAESGDIEFKVKGGTLEVVNWASNSRQTFQSRTMDLGLGHPSVEFKHIKYACGMSDATVHFVTVE